MGSPRQVSGGARRRPATENSQPFFRPPPKRLAWGQCSWQRGSAMAKSAVQSLASAHPSDVPVASRPAGLQLGSERRSGVLYSLCAYALWGLFPLYFKALSASPLQILAHRVVWSALFLSLVLSVRGGWAPLRGVEPRVLLGSFLSASLLSVNWFVYIWAVHAGRVLDGSLGYFITPLVSVLLGVLIMKEALRFGQWLAVATATSGVLWLTLQFGQLPWVGLVLAATFGSYGALRKQSALGPLDGLALETLLMLPLAVGYLIWCALHGQNDFSAGSPTLRVLLICAGPITAVPLVLFAAGARRIALSLVGVLQYISPTLQLLLGILVWHEPFSQTRFIGYAVIWFALVIYTADTLWAARQRRERALSAA
jgi:chloramphenicol-sensitive protein RarD